MTTSSILLILYFAALTCQVSVSGLSAPPPLSIGVHLRFSPLIGGPTWLPLHSSVVLSTEDDLHRYDFIPTKATDPETLARLLTLRSVPGIVRARSASSSVVSPSSGPATAVSGKNGLSFQLRSIPLPNNAEDDDASSYVVQTAADFAERYQVERGDLDLLGNSCYMFTYSLLRHLLDDPARSNE